MPSKPTNLRMGAGPAPSPPSVDPHAHFDALRARPDCLWSYSLRTQAQLNSLVKQPPSIFWTYDPANDTHPLKQDACKLWKPPRKDFRSWSPLVTHPHTAINSLTNSGDETVYLPLRVPVHSSGSSLTLTWDFWWGSEFQINKGTVNAWKAFFVETNPTNPIGEGSKTYQCFHQLLNTALVVPANGDCCAHHSDMGENGNRAPGVTDNDPFTPTGLGAVPLRHFVAKSNQWTRYLFHIEKAVPGEAFTSWTAHTGVDLSGGIYDRVSSWMWDETRSPTRVYFEVPVVRDYPYLNTLRFSFDCSTNNLSGGGLVGPVVAYVRGVAAFNNVVNLASDPMFWRLPIAG
jgi:hypothetical protein